MKKQIGGNSTNNTTLTPQRLGVELLETVQALYQSQEISASKRKQMSAEIKKGIATSDFSGYAKMLTEIRFASSFKKYIDEDLAKINNL